jgi:hypothetical protein
MSGAPRPAAGDGSGAAAGELQDATRSRAPSDASVADTLNELLRRTYLSAPSDLAAVIAEQARPLGAHDVVLYLIDYEQRTLVPLSDPRRDDLKPLSLEGTIVGRAFRTTSVLRSSSDEGNGERLWLPLLDGTERLGVIDIAFDDGPVPERTVIVCECYAHLTAMLIATKAAYGDIFEVTRRREPMNDRLRAAVAAHTAPRLRHRSPRPRRDAGALLRHGGDALDYAVNDGVLHVGIFDAMGHGPRQPAWPPPPSRPTATAAVAAAGSWRPTPPSTPRSAISSPATATLTAVIAQLQLESGRLTWVSAGHPPPLVIRHARLARTLSAPPAPRRWASRWRAGSGAGRGIVGSPAPAHGPLAAGRSRCTSKWQAFAGTASCVRAPWPLGYAARILTDDRQQTEVRRHWSWRKRRPASLRP